MNNLRVKSALRSLLLLLAALSGAACAAAEIRTVSMIQLLATPEKFHKQKIRVSGFMALAFEGNHLSPNREDYENRLFGNSVWLHLSSEQLQQWESRSRGYFLLEGTYNARSRGHMSAFNGSIEKLTRIEPWPWGTATIHFSERYEPIEGATHERDSLRHPIAADGGRYLYESLSMTRLLAAAEKYADKHVIIEGYFKNSAELAAVFLSQGDAENRVFRHAVNVPAGACSPKLSNGYVTVYGKLKIAEARQQILRSDGYISTRNPFGIYGAAFESVNQCVAHPALEAPASQPSIPQPKP